MAYQDCGVGSNMNLSPSSFTGSPGSSPMQYVPQLIYQMTDLTCNGMPLGPNLNIVEQPSQHFRFRYKSELSGAHGYLLGRSCNEGSKTTKTFPTVELKDYNGAAEIRCSLVQLKNDEDHPHQISTSGEPYLSLRVGPNSSYTAAFKQISIIQTAKKDIPEVLFRNMTKLGTNINQKEMEAKAKEMAEWIDLNRLRLKFSAHDLNSGLEVCAPVFSKPILNNKSPATNSLKICRMSKLTGRPRGSEEVYMLTDKITKNNIEIHFFELNECGEEVWRQKARFLPSDVHHQYAIVFQTPPYKKLDITTKVEVQVELVRTKDGNRSESRSFFYRPDESILNKRKRVHSYSSFESFSSGSIKFSDIPETVSELNNEDLKNFNGYIMPQQLQDMKTDLSDALYGAAVFNISAKPDLLCPTLGAPNVPEPPILSLKSGELDNIVGSADFMDYFGSLNDDPCVSSFFKSDSARKKENKEKGSIQTDPNFTKEDGLKIKALLKEIGLIIKLKKSKSILKSHVMQLFDYKTSSYETILHLCLNNNSISNLDGIVNIVHQLGRTDLLNLKNDVGQTVLHLAIVNDLPEKIDFLISKGCDPTEKDFEGSNAVHYAVICKTCLVPLLDAIARNNISCDLDAINDEKQSALHLAVMYNDRESVKTLLSRNASLSLRNREGRTVLQQAVFDGNLDVVRMLLDFIPKNEVDVLDSEGYTALQILCNSSVMQNSALIAEMLLEHGADPLKCEPPNESAWNSSRRNEKIRSVMSKFVNVNAIDEDIKSEPEEYESAIEEDPESQLQALPAYIDEVSVILNKSGRWRDLAAELDCRFLINAYENHSNPTRTLLTEVKSYNEDITSISIAKTLRNLGELEAARIIFKCIDV